MKIKWFSRNMRKCLLYTFVQESKDEQWKRAMDYLNVVNELNYMTQIVIMLYEDPNKVTEFLICMSCSVAKLCPTLKRHELQNSRLPCPSLSPWVCSNSCPLSQWCYPTISSSLVPFSSCLQSFPASGSFPMSQHFVSGGQSIGASAAVLPVIVQSWFPLRLTGLISFLSKGLSRALSSTTVRKCQFFNAQPYLWSSSHILTWLLEKL